VSFYPFYGTSATLSNLQSSLTALTKQIGKPVLVAETDWPAACSGGPALSQPAISVSASGQQTWTTDIKNVLNAIPNGQGAGIRELAGLMVWACCSDTCSSLLGTGMDWER
jgi:arabinogalactan endo-1,4-beta-galactosidase